MNWEACKTELLDITPHDAYAFFYDNTDNTITRQKICGLALLEVEYKADPHEDKCTKYKTERETRFVMAYSDGVIEHDVELTKMKDFILYSVDEPSFNKLCRAVTSWYERCGKTQEFTSPPKRDWDE